LVIDEQGKAARTNRARDWSTEEAVAVAGLAREAAREKNQRE
jgi:hypothetical protein